MKHIESIQPEYAAVDLSRLLVSDADATATAALTRLLHDWTGCAIPQTSDLPQSEVEELVPLCLSILRRHWTTPLTALGDGTTPMSLADLMRRLIGDRVQGNEALGIPAIHADIPTAVSQLLNRKIDCKDVPDGISFPRVICDLTIANEITELVDSNKGWIWSRGPITNQADSFIREVKFIYPNINHVVLNCKSSTSPIVSGSYIERYEFPYLEEATPPFSNQSQSNGCKYFIAPKLQWITREGSGYTPKFGHGLVELIMPSLRGWDGANHETIGLTYCPELEKVVLGVWQSTNTSYTFLGCPKLVHLEIGEGTRTSLNFRSWNPTTALSERLPEFLSNFQTYIADRVADRTGKYALTLTLSAAVYAALQAQEGQTILATLTSKNWTVAQA